MENSGNKLIWLKNNDLKFVQYFHRWSRGNDDEMKFYVILFHVNSELHFSKEAIESNPLLV